MAHRSERPQSDALDPREQAIRALPAMAMLGTIHAGCLAFRRLRQRQPLSLDQLANSGKKPSTLADQDLPYRDSTRHYSGLGAPLEPSDPRICSDWLSSGHAIIPTRMGPGKRSGASWRASRARSTPLNAASVTSSRATRERSGSDMVITPYLARKTRRGHGVKRHRHRGTGDRVKGRRKRKRHIFVPPRL